jgi:hypothetical protein
VTVYTDWAQSAHAGGLLTAKYAAAAANPVNTSLPRTDPVRIAQGLAQVDAVMAATVSGGAFTGHNASSSGNTGATCARCHTTEGFSYYFENLANIGINVSAGVLKCYGCHTNPAIGTLRTLKGAKANTNYTTDLGWNPTARYNADPANRTDYILNYGKLAYPDVAASNICIACHDSREKDPGAINDASTTYQRTHYLQAAATMYVKMGFITFAAGAIPGVTIDTSLLSDQDGGTITSTHRKLGTPAIIGDHGITAADTKLTSGGPCVTCHFTGSHSLTIDQKAIDAVCSKCHTSEMGYSISTKADFATYFLEPQSETYQAALALAITLFNNKASSLITLAPEPDLPEFVRAYMTADPTREAGSKSGASDLPAVWDYSSAWTGVVPVMNAASPTYVTAYNRTRVMGAVSNIVFLKREPAAYAHARTYSRRLLYDTIDYLDDGSMNGSVGATALATLPSVYGKGARAFTDSTLTALAPGTTEAMVYLIKWDRATGAWSSSERP